MKQLFHNKEKGFFEGRGLIFWLVMILFVIPSVLTTGIAIIWLVFTNKAYFTLALLGTGGYLYYRFKIKPNKSTGTAKGTGNPETLSLYGQQEIPNPYAGIFICGGAGSGKSKSLIEPLIYDAGQKAFTGVVYDYKFPELASYVNTAYQNRSVKPYFFNFTDLSTSCRINPIAPRYMINTSYAREFAYSVLANINPQIIQKPDFWSDNSLTLLTAIFWYLRQKHPQFCTLPHAVSLALTDQIDLLLELLKLDSECKDMIAPILSSTKSDNQFAGVVSSLQISLTKINVKEIYYLMNADETPLNVSSIDNPSILVLGNNPQLDSTYSPILSLILSSISKQLNTQGNQKSVFMIDEFPTIYVPNIEKLPATARSNKVATILACQDIAQIVDAYGKEKTESVLSNLGNQFYGRTTNPQTAQRVSQLFGKEDRLMETTTHQRSPLGNRKLGKGESYSYQERELVRTQDVAKLNTGSFFTILSEGKQKQGLLSVNLINFGKSPLNSLNGYSESLLDDNYTKVKKEVDFILFES